MNELFAFVEMVCRPHLQASLAIGHIKAEYDKLLKEQEQIINAFPDQGGGITGRPNMGYYVLGKPEHKPMSKRDAVRTLAGLDTKEKPR